MKREPILRITRYEMRVAQKRPLLSFQLETSDREEFFFQVDIQRSLVNISLFLTTKALDNRLEECMAKLIKKKTDTVKMKNNTFVPMSIFEQACELLKRDLPNYKELTQGIKMLTEQLSNRTKFLEREEVKRRNSPGDDQEKEQRSKLERFQKKFTFLLNHEYELETEESFEELYGKVRKQNDLPHMSNSVVQLHFSQLKKKYASQYERLSKMPGKSAPTSHYLSKGLTSLYVMRTDFEATVGGRTYNVVKVGKTNKSIFDYERNLYEDYKWKILFEYVYLGIFYQQAGKVIDHYFHDRLVKIPASKFFIFNYTDFEDNVRVAQEFYLLTEEFILTMEELLNRYCEAHKQPAPTA